MALTIADIGTQLLMDSTDSLQEIEARITARVFGAVHHPERGPTVRKVLEELLAVPAARQPPARTVNPAARDSRVGRVTARLVAPLLLPSPPIRGITNTEGSQTMTQDTKATTCAPKFQLGQIVATPGAICTEDEALNDQALVEGEPVLSAYAIDESKPAKGYCGNCLRIITERDRSETTFLLPDEY
jgi:hypothetical protein